MKKLFAMLLIAAMALVLFVACGDTSVNTDTSSVNASANGSDVEVLPPSGSAPAEITTESLVGDWGFEMDFSEMSADFKQLGYSAKMNGTFSFSADGTAKLFFAKTDFAAAMEQILRQMMTIEYVAEQSGISVDALQSSLAQQGLTWDAYLDSVIDTSLDLMIQSSLANAGHSADADGNIVLSSGKYKVEDGKLYVAEGGEYTEDDGVPFTYADGKLTFSQDGITLVLEKK